MAGTETRARRAAAWVCAAAALAMAAGCASAGMGMGSTPDGAAHATLAALDLGEMEEGRLAQQKAAGAPVRQYGQQMVTDHSAALRQVQASMDAMGMGMGTVAPAGTGGGTGASPGGGSPGGTGGDPEAMRRALMANPYSRPIVEDHVRAMQMLRSTPAGAAFDMAYMDRQVAAHRYGLATIDNQMPSLEAGASPRTVALARQHRAAVEQHLRLAEQIRGGLAR